MMSSGSGYWRPRLWWLTSHYTQDGYEDEQQDDEFFYDPENDTYDDENNPAEDLMNLDVTNHLTLIADMESVVLTNTIKPKELFPIQYQEVVVDELD